MIYHQFWSHEDGRDYGSEIDALLSRKFGAYLTVLAKAAWYEDGGAASRRATRPDTGSRPRWRSEPLLASWADDAHRSGAVPIARARRSSQIARGGHDS